MSDNDTRDASATKNPSGDTIDLIERLSTLLRQYQQIVGSDAMKSVFVSAQIHGQPYRGEKTDSGEVQRALDRARTFLDEQGVSLPE